MTVRPPVASERMVCTSFRAVVESNPDVGCTRTEEGAGERLAQSIQLCKDMTVWYITTDCVLQLLKSGT